MHNALGNLRFATFTAHFRIVDPLRLPPYPGSTLHGAFGRSLRQVRYGMRETCPTCRVRSECRHLNLCAYFAESPCDHPFIKPAHDSLYERMQRDVYPQPLIFTLPKGGDYQPGESMAIPFTLLGRAIPLFPFVACALALMGERGLGMGRGRMLLETITGEFPPIPTGENIVYDGTSSTIDGPTRSAEVRRFSRSLLESPNPGPDISVRRIRVAFLTPFRYKSNGRLGEELTFEVFIRSLLRRLTLLSVHSPLDFAVDYGELLALARGVKVEESRLTWFEFPRFSGRQKEWLNLGGFTGSIIFGGEITPFVPFIQMGEFLNVGKAASFGHGNYSVAILREGGTDVHDIDTAEASAQ